MHVYRLEATGRYGEALVLEQGAEVPCPIGEGIVVRLAEVFAAAE